MKKLMSCLAVILVAGVTVIAGEVDLEGVKCVVANRDATADKSAEYKEGEVFFCCGNCAAKFAKDKEKYSVKANHQLVATGQYEQKACPLSGGDLNPETAIKLAGTKVAFCCNNCKGKVESESDAQKQLALVYSDKAFEKGFEKKSADDEG